MTEQTSNQSSGTTWFVGASFGHTDDQSARFLEEGIWEISSPSQKEQALVRSMRPGERIAIKAAYVRKHGLPFDNRQQTVSVMGIKAIGIIILGWGIVQVGLSFQSHDPSQRSNGFLTLAGGIVITFAKEILNLITG